MSSQLVSQTIHKILSRAGTLDFPFAVVTPDGETTQVGEGSPDFTAYIRNQDGLNAFISFNQLKITEAYIAGDIDIEGDAIKAMCLRDGIPDDNFYIKTWRKLKPLLFGRPRCNPDWIAKHYDSDNIQLYGTENLYHTYTEGHHSHEEESLEAAIENKFAFIFDMLKLKEGDTLLDVGCGWGGILRYTSRRGVQATGITLSNHQRQFAQSLIDQEKLTARAVYQDFFTYEPEQKYDAVTMTGVMEDLSDYHFVMERLAKLVKPGGRVFLDFATDQDPKGSTSTFTTKYIWPGAFRLVYLPEFIQAVTHSPFELHYLSNDRNNYYLWAKGFTERWEKRKQEVVERTSEAAWRIQHIISAGTAATMYSPNYYASAHKVVLELPKDTIFV